MFALHFGLFFLKNKVPGKSEKKKFKKKKQIAIKKKVRNNDFKCDNFGEWLFNNIKGLPNIKILLFANNPGISGELNYQTNEYFKSAIQVFTGFICICLFYVFVFFFSFRSKISELLC